jgi:hypothetical protein
MPTALHRTQTPRQQRRPVTFRKTLSFVLVLAAAACAAPAGYGLEPASSTLPDGCAPDWRQRAAAAVEQGDFHAARGLYLDALLRTDDPCQRALLSQALATVVERQERDDGERNAVLAWSERRSAAVDRVRATSLPAVAAR